jgi:sugar phosphate isomerase/epimerase
LKLAIVLSTQPAQFAAVAFKGDFESNAAKIADLGYDGVELAIRDPRLVDVDHLLRAVSGHGLGVPALGTGHIPFAARTGAVIIIGLLRGLVRPGVGQAQAMDWLVEALQECCATAAPEGVRIALEPINRYETSLVNNAREGMDLLERVGAANMGLLLDTFHMNIEDAVIEESIRLCGDRIFHFHVADSNRWYPGAGHIDFESVLGALYATGYDGYVSGEFMPVPDADVSARKNIAYLRSLGL